MHYVAYGSILFEFRTLGGELKLFLDFARINPITDYTL